MSIIQWNQSLHFTKNNQMKKHFILFLLCSFPLLIFGTDSSILFRQIPYDSLFHIASKENKGIMLYFHFDGCGGCVTMEKEVFSDPNVIAYMNSHFVNFEINTQKPEGIETNKNYGIKLNPTFLFLDKSGKELHKLVGVFSVETFLEEAKNALLTDKTLENYKQLYKNGNRNTDFLYDYVYMLKNAYEVDSLVVNEYLNTIDTSQYLEEKNIQFMYEFCVVGYNYFLPFNNPKFQFILQHKETFYRYFDKEEVDARIVFILNNAIYKAIEEKDEEMFNEAIAYMRHYDRGSPYYFKEMDGRITGMTLTNHLVLSSQLAFYNNTAQQIKYEQTLKQYLPKIWDNEVELNNFAWQFVEYKEQIPPKIIKTAIKCAKRAIQLNNSYSNNDTYAWLLYKSGATKKALKQAKKSIALAQTNNQSFEETQKLIDVINGTFTE